MKKLHVNAQVTASICLTEFSFGFVFILISYFTNANKLVRLWLIDVLYMLILPHLFLMNTAHNKDRVLELGWKNIFLNLLHVRCLNKFGNFSGNEIICSDTEMQVFGRKLKKSNDKNDIKISNIEDTEDIPTTSTGKH